MQIFARWICRKPAGASFPPGRSGLGIGSHPSEKPCASVSRPASCTHPAGFGSIEIGPEDVVVWFDEAIRDRLGEANRALEILCAEEKNLWRFSGQLKGGEMFGFDKISKRTEFLKKFFNTSNCQYIFYVGISCFIFRRSTSVIHAEIRDLPVVVSWNCDSGMTSGGHFLMGDGICS